MLITVAHKSSRINIPALAPPISQDTGSDPHARTATEAAVHEPFASGAARGPRDAGPGRRACARGLAPRRRPPVSAVWNRFQYSVRSSQSSSWPAGGASDGYGLGRGAAGPDRRCTTTAAGALRVIV